MRGLGHFLGILPHVGVGHGDAVVVGIMDEEVRRLAVEDQSLGAILLNLHHEPIGHLAVITVAEALSSHGNGDGAIVHMANLKGNLASGGHGAEFFVAHGCYSMRFSSLSSLKPHGKASAKEGSRKARPHDPIPTVTTPPTLAE